jgi:molybdate transport system permease protein
MAQFMIATPFVIRSFKTAFGGVNPKLEEAAMILGDGYFTVFRRITLPLAREGIISGITLGWARAMGEFGATIMLAGATRLRTETLPIAVYLNISTGDMDVAIAISLLMIIFSIIILAILKLFGSEGIYRYEGD